ncbi:RING-H2 finger protein ATL63 [Syzygium oleosum]|uniref:RING-H2 finger protein ATL63 n=1 Tax=Syzygium oleosum TaxID=219896 RepID=UPI0024BAB536|nr:RING-H2 finger protein ATL63 [Syzygium oleosum]
MMSFSSTSPADPSAAAASRSGSGSRLANTVFSYDGNVMLAAIISLLLVILFVLLLHFYAKCFLSSSSHRRRQRRLRPPPSSAVLSARDADLPSPSPPRPASKGLDPSTISSIPFFVARPGGGGGGEKDEECVVCLGGFEENDVGRRLPECGHGFHVDCIDTWLRSRASCPICREPVVADTRKETENKNKLAAAAEDANSDGSAQEGGDATVQEETGSGLTEIAIDIVHDGGGGNDDDDDDDVGGSPSSLQLQPSSSSSAARSQQPATTLGGSLKRMLSRNRAESKIHPSSAPSPSSVNINEPEPNASC